MKKNVLSFVSGMIAMLLLAGLPVTALAASGAIRIEVSPISVLVDGEVFQPKDAKGNDVMVFTYNGTTYAPLRALAEAYGLEVGYGGERHIATVSKQPTQTQAPIADTGYAGFERQWTVKEKPVTNYGSEKIYTAAYSGSLSMSEFKTWWKSLSEDEIAREAEKLAAEAQSLNPGYTVTMYFSYGSYNLGTAFAYGDYEFSNFSLASVWIK